MDFNTFVAAEKWANYTLPTLAFVAVILFTFVGLIPVLTNRNKFTKILFWITTAFALGTVGLTFFQNNRYQEYFNQVKYISSKTRSYKESWWHKEYFDPNEVNAMKYLSDWETPSKLSVYHRTPISQDIKYLGRDDYYVYVEYKGLSMRYGISSTKQSKDTQTKFVGYKFTMPDKRYKTVGFFDLKNYFVKEISIPKSVYDTRVSASVQKNYGRPGLAGNWIVDSDK